MRTLFFSSVLVFCSLLALASQALGQTYSYDAAGRLTQATYADGTTIAYTYDAAGNVTTQNVTPTPPGGGGGGGCFIASAAYGSPLHPHVQTLREFRDRHLLTNAPGRSFCRLYAALSPPMAAFLEEHPALKPPVRVALAPFVYSAAHPRTALVLALAATLALRAWRRRAVAKTGVGGPGSA